MSDPQAPPPGEGWRSALRGIAALVAPTTVVTALLYYFGWARTSTQAHLMGLEQSLFGYSARDYILRSMSSLFTPLFVGLVVVLVGIALHMAIIRVALPPAGPPRSRRTLRLFALVPMVVGGAMGVAGFLGAAGLPRDVDTRVTEEALTILQVIFPLSVTVGIGLVGYGVHLRRRLVGSDTEGEEPTGEERALRLLAAAVFPLLLLLGMFWTVSKYAALKGRELAAVVENRMPFLPDVTIYSARRLELQPPVTEREVGSAESAFPFQYTNLKLLFLSDGKYFLRPTGSTLNIVIADSQDLRFEFSKPSFDS